MRKIRWIACLKTVAVVGFVLMAGSGCFQTGGSRRALVEGSGRFVFEDTAENPGKQIPVWYHRPAGDLSAMPVIFVLPGRFRNADGYRDHWVPLSREYGFLVVAPEFSMEHFPGMWRYGIGNVSRVTGERKPESVWIPTLIEKIFDTLRGDYGVTADRYDLFGRSAGAQLVHRMILFKSGSRVRTAIAANPGWYTMPDDSVGIPYGTANAGIDRETFRAAFAMDLVILLGTADKNSNHPFLRRAPEATAQGRHRLERGRNFFAKARKFAAGICSPFAWRLEYADGVGHSSHRMARFAARILKARD